MVGHPRSRGLFELPAITERDAVWLGESNDREVTLSALCLHHAMTDSRGASGALTLNLRFLPTAGVWDVRVASFSPRIVPPAKTVITQGVTKQRFWKRRLSPCPYGFGRYYRVGEFAFMTFQARSRSAVPSRRELLVTL